MVTRAKIAIILNYSLVFIYLLSESPRITLFSRSNFTPTHCHQHKPFSKTKISHLGDTFAYLTDGGRFEMVLADRLSKLLQERDQRKTNEGSGWLETEALSGTMQEMGTFKKALWRRFLSVVAPILSEVIAYVDRDGNLELADSEDNWVVKLWLKILQDSSLTELRFADFILEEGGASVVRSKVPVLKSGYRSHSFLCKFPFSWLLKERMDELCKDARNIAGEININFSLFPSNLVFKGNMAQCFETSKLAN